jgi:ribosomal protein L9
MANGLMGGVGSFAQGFAQGYGDAQKMRLAQEASNREKERLGFEKQRVALEEQNAQRQAELHGLNKQLTQMQIDREKLDQEHQTDLKSSLAKITSELDATNEGEVIDSKTGNSVGFVRYNNINDIAGDLMKKGQTIRPGSEKKTGPITDPIQRNKRIFQTMHIVNARHGKLTPDQLKLMEDNERNWRAADIEKAMNYFVTSNDENGAKEILAKAGVKIDPKSKFIMQVDENTGEKEPVVGIIGSDGKFQKQYDMSDLYLMTVDPSTAAKVRAEFKLSMKKQTASDKAAMSRTEKTVQGGIEEALIRARSGGGGGGNDKMIDRVSKEINDQFSMIESGLKLSTNVVGSNDYINRKLKAVALARDYIASGQANSVAKAAYMGWRDAGLPAAPAAK